MLAIVFGLLFVVGGIWMIAGWFDSFITVVKGLLPILIFGAGFIAVVAGISSILDAAKERKSASKTDSTESK